MILKVLKLNSVMELVLPFSLHQIRNRVNPWLNLQEMDPSPNTLKYMRRTIAPAHMSLPHPAIAYVCAGSGCTNDAQSALGRSRNGLRNALNGSGGSRLAGHDQVAELGPRSNHSLHDPFGNLSKQYIYIYIFIYIKIVVNGVI